MNNTEKIIKELRIILKGIDKDDLTDKDGWWGTSTGAKFGAEKLKKVEQFLVDALESVRRDERLKIVKYLNEQLLLIQRLPINETYDNAQVKLIFKLQKKLKEKKEEE